MDALVYAEDTYLDRASAAAGAAAGGLLRKMFHIVKDVMLICLTVFI